MDNSKEKVKTNKAAVKSWKDDCYVLTFMLKKQNQVEYDFLTAVLWKASGWWDLFN